MRRGRAAPAPERRAWAEPGRCLVGVDDLICGETRHDYDVNGQVAEARFEDRSSERFSYDAVKIVMGARAESLRVEASLGGLLARPSTPDGVK